MYELVYRALLRHLPAETAHRAGFWLIRAAGALPGGTWWLRRLLAPRDPALRVQALGLELPGPLGLAAGFDKDARGVDALAALGFAFIEVGTVTAQAQPGNPRPRMFRLPADRALVNRMGFNNAGAAAAAERLRARQLRGRPVQAARPGTDGASGARGGGGRPRDRVVVGVNIGKTKAVPTDEAIADYVTSARLVAGVADYVVVNVSSPNTPGLRELQAVSSLGPLLAAVRAALDGPARRPPRSPEAGTPSGNGAADRNGTASGNGAASGTGSAGGAEGADGVAQEVPPAAGGRRVPLLVKIAPDLADSDVDAIADLAVELGLDGIIATNTTIARPGLASGPVLVAAAGEGGLSGAPLRPRALEVLRRLHARAGDQLVLIAAGGIETADDAWERIAAGATLVQAYTGFIYGGPRWPRRVQKGLVRRLRAAGLKSVGEARGTSAGEAGGTSVAEARGTSVSEASGTSASEASATSASEASATSASEASATSVSEASATSVSEASATSVSEANGTEIAQRPGSSVADEDSQPAGPLPPELSGTETARGGPGEGLESPADQLPPNRPGS